MKEGEKWLGFTEEGREARAGGGCGCMAGMEAGKQAGGLRGSRQAREAHRLGRKAGKQGLGLRD